MIELSKRRECGTRKKGGIYGCCPTSENGRPLEEFLMDPPIPISAEEWGISPVGVKLIEREGIWHVVDWIGEEHYPNIADFLEEIRAMGVSRRFPRTLDFAKLTPASRMIFVHRKAWFGNTEAHYQREAMGLAAVGILPTCPCRVPEHAVADPKITCARLWWEDLDRDTKPADPLESAVYPGDMVLRHLECGRRYSAVLAPKGAQPEYHPAIFVSFPLISLEVIRDPEGGEHERSLEAAGHADLPTFLMEE